MSIATLQALLQEALCLHAALHGVAAPLDAGLEHLHGLLGTRDRTRKRAGAAAVEFQTFLDGLLCHGKTFFGSAAGHHAVMECLLADLLALKLAWWFHAALVLQALE